MSDMAVSVQGIGKEYAIGGQTEAYGTMRDMVVGAIVSPIRRIRNIARGGAAVHNQQSFWALRDVSFDVRHGEAIGIIGRNGAGKSTLLKILSRITEPTRGRATVYGRVGALLEVGTGFHPELTGRENIFLNGAILGMGRAEIDRKFDEIVDFAGVEKFIDTPVKHYSSGMGLRLGFAVAAHLEPEILIVDEVLAVGDAEFQKKCLGKMQDVAGSGRTVLFVSHNLGAVQSLCTRGIVLRQGQVVADADVVTALSAYLEDAEPPTLYQDLSQVSRKGSQAVRFLDVQIARAGQPGAVPMIGSDIEITTRLHSREAFKSVVICAVIHDASGARIIDVNNGMLGEFADLEADSTYTMRFMLEHVLLRPGIYRLELFAAVEHQQTFDAIPSAMQFEIAPNLQLPEGKTIYPGAYRCQFRADLTLEADRAAVPA